MKSSYLNNIVQIMNDLGGKATYAELYDEYEKLTGEELTASKKATIRKTIEDYSSDSKNFKGKEDLFYSVHGMGRGTWGLRNINDPFDWRV